MNFWGIAESPWLWILVSAGLVFVAGLAAIFMVKAWKRCLELGIENTTVKKVVTSSLTFSIVPSISIVIGLFSLAAVIGRPWAWFRLSVVGAVSYELMAADMVSQAMGYESLTMLRNEPGEVMGAIMIVMSIGIIGGIVTNTFAAKKITTSMSSFTAKSGGWGALFSGCFMMAMMSVFIPNQLSNGPVALLTMLTSAAITLILSAVAKAMKWGWLNNFILAVTLILGMVSAVGWNALITNLGMNPAGWAFLG